MVTLLKKKLATAAPEKILELLAGQQKLSQECEKHRHEIEQLHTEREQVRIRLGEREALRASIETQMHTAQQAVEQQEAYVGLFAGRAGADELVKRRATLNDLEQRRSALIDAHASIDVGDHERLEAIERHIMQQQKRIATLEVVINDIGEERGKLTQAQGEALYDLCGKRLSEVLLHEHEAGKMMLAARADVAQARSETQRTLEQWPELRRKLTREFAAREDSTSLALAAFLGFLDLLLAESEAIHQARAGLPSGVGNILQEMALDEDQLLSLSRGYATGLEQKRQRIAGVLEAYKRNLSAM